MIAGGKRVCQSCGTSLLASVRSCPVCALRNALESEESGATSPESFRESQYRFEHYEVVIGEDQKPLELGRGAMGVTYKAIDTSLQRAVALKLINSRYLDDESVRQRFLTEARAAAGLRHPNVASIFHLGAVQGDYFYAMEFPLTGLCGLAVKNDILYVSVFGGNSGIAEGVYTYNATTGALIKGPFVSVNEPWGVAISRNSLYVASYHDFVIYEFDAATGAKLSNSIVLNDAPINLTVEPAKQQ